MQKITIFGCPANKSQNSILKHVVQNRYYDGLKAYIGAFHPPERGPVCAPTRHSRPPNVENFGSNLGPNLGVADIPGHISATYRPRNGVRPGPKLGSHTSYFPKNFHCLTPICSKIGRENVQEF